MADQIKSIDCQGEEIDKEMDIAFIDFIQFEAENTEYQIPSIIHTPMLSSICSHVVVTQCNK